jgi:D-amino-acid dehydrogenase
MKSAIVLGAGMVGVSTALALRDRGWDVALVDRKAPGQETSFGNAGIIQSEAVEPYAMPRSLRELAEIAVGLTNDVHYTFRELPHHVGSLLRYWWYSQSSRHQAISVAYASLITQATATHDALIKRAGADNLIRHSGYRVLYRDRAELDAAIKKADRLSKTFGLDFRALSSTEMALAEPALTSTGAGAIHWLGPWTASDPGSLVTSYAELFARTSGRFIHGDAGTLRATGSDWAVDTEEGAIEAEHAVVALGPWSDVLLKPFGHRFPMVRKRGYHAHYRSPQSLHAPVMDTEFGYVLAPMAKGTRITTGAHLTRPERPGAYGQLERAEEAARQLMKLGTRVEDTPWQGTRPCMPDMLPVIGASEGNKGLWMNFGHGHQGFTLGPASANLLAAMMAGETLPVDPAPFSPGRY